MFIYLNIQFLCCQCTSTMIDWFNFFFISKWIIICKHLSIYIESFNSCPCYTCTMHWFWYHFLKWYYFTCLNYFGSFLLLIWGKMKQKIIFTEHVYLMTLNLLDSIGSAIAMVRSPWFLSWIYCYCKCIQFAEISLRPHMDRRILAIPTGKVNKVQSIRDFILRVH